MTFVVVKTVLRHGRMFQGSDEVKNPLLYHAEQRNSERPTVLHSAVDLKSFLQLLLLQWSRYH